MRAYIDDLLILTKGSFVDHLLNLASVLYRLQKAGLKVNEKNPSLLKSNLNTWAEGLHGMVASQLNQRLRHSNKLPHQRKRRNYADLLAWSITIETCGSDDPMS